MKYTELMVIFLLYSETTQALAQALKIYSDRLIIKWKQMLPNVHLLKYFPFIRPDASWIYFRRKNLHLRISE